MLQKFRYIGILQGKEGRPKIKYTNNLERRYYKFGDLKQCLRCDFVDFEQEYTKHDLLQKLLKNDKFQSNDDQLLISDELDKQQDKLKKLELKLILTKGQVISKTTGEVLPA